MGTEIVCFFETCSCRNTIEKEKTGAIARATIKQRMVKSILPVLLILLFFALAPPDSQAPELTERDIYGYDTYRVSESGAILDKDGAIKGWFKDNRVYDTQWNEEPPLTPKRSGRTR